MKKLGKILSLDFLPRNVDLGLLVLRVWIGGAMLWLHGLGKAKMLIDGAKSFPDPLGVGGKTSLILAVIGEVVCPVLLILGLWTRLGALGAAVTMGVAFFAVHEMQLTGRNSGEMAFVYMAPFVALLIAGGGKYGLDGKGGGGARKSGEGSAKPKKSSE